MDTDFSLNLLSLRPENKDVRKKYSPLGKMPIWHELDINGDGEVQFSLTEARAISEYVAQLVPASGTAENCPVLVPEEVEDLARMHQWMNFETTEFYPHMFKIYWERVLKPRKGLGDPIESVVADASKLLEQSLDVIESQLKDSGKSYLLGDSLTLADTGFVPYLEGLHMAKCGDLLESRPCVNAWSNGLRERQSWRKILEMTTKECFA